MYCILFLSRIQVEIICYASLSLLMTSGQQVYKMNIYSKTTKNLYEEG